ncbi:hypothetical protein [Sphingobacterium cellulitidis]|uniref:hypothetical protein n=1 Tax=Sphingobacterium cellulitidis TaxID=1768011 RepID=UPI000B93FA48|nr:hypothetical protein CHT99_15580 [Sphingobacterium cellulitidis]
MALRWFILMMINGYLRFIILISVIALILLSLIFNEEADQYRILSYYLLIAYFVLLIIDNIIVAKHYEKTKEMFLPRNYLYSNSLLNCIVIFGLIMGMAQQKNFIIIWGIYLGYYALNGLIFSMITNIPFKMTSGGWRRSRMRR